MHPISWFEPALTALGRQVVQPTNAVLDGAMLPAIASVKAGRLAEAGPLMNSAVQSLLDRGAQVVILARSPSRRRLKGWPATASIRHKNLRLQPWPYGGNCMCRINPIPFQDACRCSIGRLGRVART